MPASSAKAKQSQRASCSAARRSSTTTRPSRWWSPRPSSRRAPRPSSIRVDYVRDDGRFDLAAQIDVRPAAGGDSGEGSARRRCTGSATSRARSRPRRSRSTQTYTTPDQSHAMMEPHATIAAWQGDALTLWTSNQMIAWAARDIGETLLHPEGEDPRHLALHRRRLRREAVDPQRRGDGGARRARGGAAGQGRAGAAADASTTPRIVRRRSSASASARPRTARSPRSRTRAGRATCPAAGRRRRSSRRGCSTRARIA